MSSSKKGEKLEWSDWQHSTETGMYFRVGYDSNGNVVKRETWGRQQSVPRGADDVGALATNFGNVSIGDAAGYQEPGGYPDSAGYQESTGYTYSASQHLGGGGSHDYGQASQPKSSKGKGRESKPKSSSTKATSSSAKPKSSKRPPSYSADIDESSKDDPFYSVEVKGKSSHGEPSLGYGHHPFGGHADGKDRNPEHPDSYYPETYDEPQIHGQADFPGPYPPVGAKSNEQTASHLANEPASVSPGYYHQPAEPPGDHAQDHRPHPPKSRKGKERSNQPPPSMAYETTKELDGFEEDEDDEEMVETMNRVRGLYNRGIEGEASFKPSPDSYEPVDSYGQQPGELTPRASTPAVHPAFEPDFEGYAQDDERPIALSNQNHIQGDPNTGAEEQLDPRYIIQPSHMFQPGGVFKILWSEPHGSGKNDAKVTDNEIRTIYGERFYICFRRFVVVANDEGHCTCVPILTYERRGCTKRGVKASKHGIVHATGTKPKPLDKEPKLGFKPVGVQLIRGEKLAPQSRINYSKLITVEHNVKVFFIGQILDSDFDNIVSPAIDQCWNEKSRDMRKKHHGHH